MRPAGGRALSRSRENILMAPDEAVHAVEDQTRGMGPGGPIAQLAWPGFLRRWTGSCRATTPDLTRHGGSNAAPGGGRSVHSAGGLECGRPRRRFAGAWPQEKGAGPPDPQGRGRAGRRRLLALARPRGDPTSARRRSDALWRIRRHLAADLAGQGELHGRRRSVREIFVVAARSSWASATRPTCTVAR